MSVNVSGGEDPGYMGPPPSAKLAALDVTRRTIRDAIAGHLYLSRNSSLDSRCSCGGWTESVQRKPFTTWHDHLTEKIMEALG